MHFDAPLRQLVGHDAGGADLLEADLGMRVQVAADRGEFVGIAVDTFDVWACSLSRGRRFGEMRRLREKTGPFGLVRMPGRSRVHGSAAVSAGIAPGAAQIRSVSAIGSKSARKCTELLLTRIDLLVGSMPT